MHTLQRKTSWLSQGSKLLSVIVWGLFSEVEIVCDAVQPWAFIADEKKRSIYSWFLWNTQSFGCFVKSANDLMKSYFLQIFIIALPVLAPFSIAMNAAGMLSKPAVTCSLHRSFPWNINKNRTSSRDKGDKTCYSTGTIQCNKNGKKTQQEQCCPSWGPELSLLQLCLPNHCLHLCLAFSLVSMQLISLCLGCFCFHTPWYLGAYLRFVLTICSLLLGNYSLQNFAFVSFLSLALLIFVFVCIIIYRH